MDEYARLGIKKETKEREREIKTTKIVCRPRSKIWAADKGTPRDLMHEDKYLPKGTIYRQLGQPDYTEETSCW